MDSNLQTRARQIQLLLLDVDGILTDGRLFYGTNGTELKAFSTLDGHGIKLLQSAGVRVGIISGRQSEAVTRRAGELGVELLVQGREDKWQALEEIRQREPTPLEQIAFMGDDWPDLTVMSRVGLALTVPNAHPSVAQRAHWQSQLGGGEGAVREACDMLLTAQGHFERLLASYLAD